MSDMKKRARHTVTITVDEDVLRLMTYREVLRAIVREGKAELWRDDGAAHIARKALDHFGDLESGQ